jgi:Putative prokaryotic signal transducing protein
MDETELVVVRTFNTPQEADLAASALEAAGIDVMRRSDNVGGQRSHLAWAGTGNQVVVRAEDLEEARAILDIPAKL